jgi:hypothetical protein
VRWTGADEGRHDDAPGVESWGFEFGSGRTTGRIRLSLDVTHGRAGYLADLLLPGAGRVVVADESVPVPRATAGLEIRAEGLWASCYCETPFEHWSLGLEAFGLRLEGADAGAEPAHPAPDGFAWERLVGERLAVGFDLEWELRGLPEPLSDGAGYAQPGVVFGEVMVVRDRIAVDAPAVRDHWWGGAPGVRDAPSRLTDADG